MRQPVRRRPRPTVQCAATVRVPLAGPYWPIARLYRFPDGRLLWHLRLWEFDRPVSHLFATSALIAYARASGLAALEEELRAAVEEATRGLR